ncbi:fimbrial protein [Aeromonas hydrophila]
MNETVLSAAILLSFAAFSMSANAAQINFTGAVTAQSCELKNGGDLNVNLSTIAESDVKEAEQAKGAMSLAATVECEGENPSGTVTMALMPVPGAVNGKVLKNTTSGGNAAKGVGFVVFGDNGSLLDFTEGRAEITAPMNSSGVANIIIAVNYAKDGSGDEVEAGDVKAVLPFVLTYK